MRAPAASCALAILLLGPLAGVDDSWAEGVRPTVVDVPSRPAFVQPPGSGERPARVGEMLLERSLVGTRTPGRLQVRLGDGCSLRLGGDAVLRLQGGDLRLERGRLIAWIHPGTPRRQPLRIRTRSATASILGTTVFLEVSPEQERIFSWEGNVAVRTAEGREWLLPSGQQLLCVRGRCGEPQPMPAAEKQQRRRSSDLLNGFTAPMDTLPLIDRALGLQSPP